MADERLSEMDSKKTSREREKTGADSGEKGAEKTRIVDFNLDDFFSRRSWHESNKGVHYL